MRWLAIVGMLGLASVAGAAELRDPGRFASPIAFEQIAVPEPGMLAPPAEPGLVLAQRVIDREWTTRGDSLSNPNYVTGGKSEMGSLAMSAAVPGAGQLYSGERSGFVYMAAEVVAIASAVFLHNKAGEDRSNAAQLAGAPADSASGWSAARWSSATAADSRNLIALYQADPEAYYDKIAKDPALAAGWASGETKDQFVTLRDESDLRLHRASIATAGIWINHLVSAVDALRAARLYNLPLRRGMEIKGNARWRKDGPAVRFAVVQKF